MTPYGESCIVLLIMGVVYSQETIQLGRVPSRDQLTDAAENVTELLTFMYDEGLIDHAMVHGSVPEGRHNTRSDLDAYIVHKDIRTASSSLRKLRSVATKEADVVLEPVTVPLSFTAATTNTMMYDPLFIYHLKEDFEKPGSEWIVGGPDKRITNRGPLVLDHQEIGRIMSAYVGYKLNGFFKLIVDVEYIDSEAQRSGFQRALEFPKSMYRKLQQAEQVNPNELTDTSRLGFAAFLEQMVDKGMITDKSSRLLQQVRQADSGYSLLLEDFSQGTARVDDVKKLLADNYGEVVSCAAMSAEDILLSFEEYFK